VTERSPKRRAVLSVFGSLVAGGCLGQNRPPESRIAWIWLRNDRDQRYEVEVVVEDGSEMVFSETFELGTGPETANVNVENPIDGPGRYVVRATMDEETRAVDTTALVDGDEDCIGVRFSLLNNGSVDYWTKSMREC
jgi:hypothetical protein